MASSLCAASVLFLIISDAISILLSADLLYLAPKYALIEGCF
jgi:hypothetical protein